MKFDSSLKWNGTSATFRTFSKALEGQLIMGGATYITNNKFISTYQDLGPSYLNSYIFWDTHKVSHPQAHFDRNYLYGMLMLATQSQQHKTLMKYEDTKDGILAWAELKKENDHNGSKELRLEQLEHQLTIPYSTRDAGGIATYIDKLQVIVQELEALDPNDYGDDRKKRLLLTNVKPAAGIEHLIQKCRDKKYMTFNASAAYLRQNAILIDHNNQNKQPSRLMHVGHEEELSMTLDRAGHIFTTMAEENGLEFTYKVFNTRSLRENLSIPPNIWNKLEPSIREKINEIRNKLKSN